MNQCHDRCTSCKRDLQIIIESCSFVAILAEDDTGPDKASGLRDGPECESYPSPSALFPFLIVKQSSVDGDHKDRATCYDVSALTLHGTRQACCNVRTMRLDSARARVEK